MLAAEHVTSRFPAKVQNHDYYTNNIFQVQICSHFYNVHIFKVVFAILLVLINNRSNNRMAVSEISSYFLKLNSFTYTPLPNFSYLKEVAVDLVM